MKSKLIRTIEEKSLRFEVLAFANVIIRQFEFGLNEGARFVRRRSIGVDSINVLIHAANTSTAVFFGKFNESFVTPAGAPRVLYFPVWTINGHIFSRNNRSCCRGSAALLKGRVVLASICALLSFDLRSSSFPTGGACRSGCGVRQFCRDFLNVVTNDNDTVIE